MAVQSVNLCKCLVLVCSLVLLARVCASLNQPIRVVKQAALNIDAMNRPDSALNPPLHLNRPTASPYVGPEHLRGLSSLCITHIDHGYEYTVCPFHNVTQREIKPAGSFPAPFHGVLGFFRGWSVVNNSLGEMQYLAGDKCGEHSRRQVKLTLLCPLQFHLFTNRNQSLPLLQLNGVGESPQCVYNLNVSTPLVCHPQSMWLWPLLSKSGQALWKQLQANHTLGGLSDADFEIQKKTLLRDERITPSEDADGVPNLSMDQCSALLRQKEDTIRQLRLEIARLNDASRSSSSSSLP